MKILIKILCPMTVAVVKKKWGAGKERERNAFMMRSFAGVLIANYESLLVDFLEKCCEMKCDFLQ